MLAHKNQWFIVRKSMVKRNTVLTTTESFNAEYLLEKKPIWAHIIPHVSCQINKLWHKVAIHRVPMVDYDNKYFGEMIKDEIKMLSQGPHVIRNLNWLTTERRRRHQSAGSIVVAFATEKETSSAIRNRLCIAGRSLKVETLYSITPTNQCNKCQGFGHLESRCSKPEKCRICAANHHTSQHKCSSCTSEGRASVLSLIKCANCGESHKANDTSCEVYRAIKDRPLHVEAQSAEPTHESSWLDK